MTKEELLTKRITAISLGCDKNRVDLEKMLFRLKKYGFQIVADPSDAEIVIVNTCAFIEPAKKEAISSIFQMLRLKNDGKIEKMIVTGCLPERYAKELLNSIPEVDAFVKLKENENICNVVEQLYGVAISKNKNENGRVLTQGVTYANLKISDGCDNVCSFCTIPRIRGCYKSVKMQDLVCEAKQLAKDGVKELVLVAQDVTSYGKDIYGKPSLIELCKELCKIKGIRWIRIHYAYPELVTDELLNYIKNEEKMCKYLDIPLQHIDDKILKSMRRRLDENQTRELITKIKTEYPEIKIRSTFIVGYPGETVGQFKKLCNFLKEAQLDYVGFFPYYREEGTVSFFMKKQIPNFVKNHRLKVIQKVQANVAKQNILNQIGQSVEVLIDEFDEKDGFFIGHTEFLSKAVDFNIKILYNELNIGDFVKVKITEFDGENFKGEVL